LLESQYQLSEKLPSQCVDELSTAAQFLDTKVPRRSSWEAPEREPVGGRRGSLTRGDIARNARERRALDDDYHARLAARRERMDQAKRLAESLIEPSGFNLQVFAIYMRASIESEGVEGCHDVLRLLVHLLGAPWEGLVGASPSSRDAATGPRRSNKRSARLTGHVDAVLGQFHDWCARESLGDAGAFQRRLVEAHDDWARLGEDLGAALARRDVRASHWDTVGRLLQDLPTEPEPESPSEEASGDVVSGATASAIELPAATVVAGAEIRDVLVFQQETLRVSPRFVQLAERLSAFATLLGAKQFFSARLVARDLGATLEHFDAPAHFPDLFADYFVGCARHSAELVQFSGSEGNARWDALRRLYNTDLDRFLALETPVARATLGELSPRPQQESSVSIEVSTHFRILQTRLLGFDALLRQRQFLRASLVAEDLDRTLGSFDVALYFPRLFAEFFVGLADHAAELAQFDDEQDGARWTALSRLYETDLPRFTRLDVESTSTGAG
jgi:hypothetical protein